MFRNDAPDAQVPRHGPVQAVVMQAAELEPPTIKVEGPADITAAFLLILGRQPSPPSVFETMLSMSFTGMLQRISGGAEFREKVAAALLAKEPLPHERNHRSHALPLVQWLATRFELSSGRRARLGRVRSWRELLGLLVHDPLLGPRIFAPSILPALAELPVPPIALVKVEDLLPAPAEAAERPIARGTAEDDAPPDRGCRRARHR